MDYNKFLSSKKFHKLIYSAVILLPSILTGGIYNAFDSEQSTDSLISGLSALSTSLYSDIGDSQVYISYSLSLLLNLESFTSFDLRQMSNDINEFVYYNPFISNAFIVNQDKDILYGMNDIEILDVDYYGHVDTALEGTVSYHSTFVEGDPFIQLAYPIYSDINNTSTTELSPSSDSAVSDINLYDASSASISNTTSILPTGALVLTYSFSQLQEEFKSLNSISPNIHAHLIDINGRIITSSSNEALLWNNKTLDITKIIEDLSYDSSSTFTLFDENLLNGIYYTIPNSGWTLLVTSTPHPTVEISDFLAWLFGFLGLGGVSTTEALKRRQGNLTPAPDILNVASD